VPKPDTINVVEMPYWLLPLLAAAALCSFAAMLLPAMRPLARAPSPVTTSTSETARQLGRIAVNLGSSLQLVDDNLKKTSDDIVTKLDGATILREGGLAPILVAVGELRQNVAQLAELVEAKSGGKQAPPMDPLTLEHQLLGEYWRQFRRNPELSASFDAARQNDGYDALLNALQRLVPEDLKPSFELVVAPYQEHRMFIRSLSAAEGIVEGKVTPDADASGLMHMRELQSLLSGLQASSDAADRLQFQFKSWVADSFLTFADLYLQRCQQAHLQERQEELQGGMNIVRKVLRAAEVEPIEVTPGETHFDSACHVGRSTTNDPRFADGVITGVVRNGFIEGGRQVIRQPEVIVNRMR
jgi:hypothetical protein